ncbi:FAD-dependent monooxygenase [Streptomyces shaanxiensis]|uniref:FAD-dependent monooxygenase n=1 Tax=Streptomyces shaanxiensis TaxID=653357 RepID=A0ABP7UL89_9ACTN
MSVEAQTGAGRPDADVVVVGGGPVGLMLACELLTAGATVEVLERAPDFDSRLRAPGITVRTIEALDRRGLLDPLMEAMAEAEPAFRPARGPDGAAPASLPIRPGVLEAVLHDRAVALGARIRRRHSVTGVAQDTTGAEVTVSTPDEGTVRVRGRYVVGCDGGRSTVRKALDIPFPGEGPSLTGHQAVVTVGPPGLLERGWHRTERGVAAYAMAPSRIVSIEFDAPPPAADAPVTLAEVQAGLRRVSGTEVTLSDPRSLTRFSGSCRVAERYRVGRVLLAGDAAHVHPPFGGQGLNLGLQDAVNLGWKLAATALGTAPPGLLDTYHDERHPVGVRVVRNARAATELLRPGERQTPLFELFFDELLVDASVKRRLHEVYSMADVRYRPEDDEDVHPLVGTAAPDLPLEIGGRRARQAALHRSGRAVLVLLSDRPALRRAAEPWKAAVDVVTAHSDESPDGLDALLIRPDGYIAWACGPEEPDSPEQFRTALERWFGR